MIDIGFGPLWTAKTDVDHGLGGGGFQRRSGYPVDGADTSSSASQISAGNRISSAASDPMSCPTVRAPTIGATTPGRSRTQASATASGDVPNPSAAVATASTTPAMSSVRYGARNSWKCGDAPRESEGAPCRYLPVSTPRPS